MDMLRRLREYSVRAAARMGSEPLRHTRWARRSRVALYVLTTVMIAWEVSVAEPGDSVRETLTRVLIVATLYLLGRWPSVAAIISLPMLLTEFSYGFHPMSSVLLVPVTIAGVLVAGRSRAIGYLYVLAAIVVLLSVQRTDQPLADLASWLVVFLFPCVVGEATRYMLGSIERIRRSSTDQLRRQRRELARELHDTSIHDITAMIMALERAKLAGVSDPKAAEEIDHAIATGRQSVVSMRGVLKFLRREDIPEGAMPVVEPVVATLPTVRQVLEDARIILTRAGLTLQAHMEDQLELPMPFSVRAVVVRVIQEATANMAKYGKAGTTCTVMVERTDTDTRALFVNEVAEHGTSDAATSSGLGLVGVRERVQAVGGTVSMHHDDGRWMMQVSIPTIGTASEGQVERAGQR